MLESCCSGASGGLATSSCSCLTPEERDLSGLTPLYTSVQQAWCLLKFSRATSRMPGMFEEPKDFTTWTLQPASLQDQSCERQAVERHVDSRTNGRGLA
ncbi:hypothetical protein NHX12_010686 [Muraenolepis orangiensis]|uniref:Uncharacterized protein n=1 Tax=Muraenolepis orangiensis TaxID=630683 RepID=A0A9Q0DJL7_9TELE|nr:hypothetical protein NHX12_010686 [Muraenolepis orangiensis]